MRAAAVTTVAGSDGVTVGVVVGCSVGRDAAASGVIVVGCSALAVADWVGVTVAVLVCDADGIGVACFSSVGLGAAAMATGAGDRLACTSGPGVTELTGVWRLLMTVAIRSSTCWGVMNWSNNTSSTASIPIG